MERLVGWRKRAGSATKLPDCSLVVPTYRRPGEALSLAECLRGLADSPGEVVFVDGSGDERTEAALRDWSRDRLLPFDLLYVRSPPGLTRQRNVGIDASRGAFVFYLDDDCVPEPGFFQEIRNVFERDREGSVGAVCGSFTNTLSRKLSLRWRLRLWLGLVPADADPGRYYPTATSVPRELLPPFTGAREVDLVPGGATAYRRQVLDQYRFSLFFDGYAQGEDVEMSMRIGRTWRKLWTSDALVLHDHALGGRPAPFRKGAMETRNRYFIWKRYTPNPSFGVRVRYWADMVYVISFDLVLFVGRPPRLDHLAHAAGAAAGAASCLVTPPRYEEPPPLREYEIDWQR